MGTRALEIVRFRGRYYIRYHQYDGYYDSLGDWIVSSIPADPEEYRKWLQSMRTEYAAKEHRLEQHAYGGSGGSAMPDHSRCHEFEMLPSELPRLNGFWAQYFYIINLDCEVLTMNFSIHWKLGNIPRQDRQWLRAIKDSIYKYKPTICPDVCSEEHMASTALELPKSNPIIDYDSQIVTPRQDIGDARKAFLMHVLAGVVVEYNTEITRFGREWRPDSLPFRELTFALLSTASGLNQVHSFPPQWCNSQDCSWWGCEERHLHRSPGWSGEDWIGDNGPMLIFGSMSHRSGEPAGVSPTETMYWLDNVLVSLSLVVDGAAVTKAVTWGIDQGSDDFQLVVISLFEVVFAEVSTKRTGSPFVQVTRAISLSPLREHYCVSTHPRERPVLKPGMQYQPQRGELILKSKYTETVRRLQQEFPGLAALVNFFDVAAIRRRATMSAGFFPVEIYSRILDFVDYNTWRACSIASNALRSCCLRKYRLDDRIRITAGPFVRQEGQNKRLLSFDFENMQTGDIVSVVESAPHFRANKEDYKWMPVIGGSRQAPMEDVILQFQLADETQVKVDSGREDQS